ncbi:Thymidylate kinase [Lacunisphaera limnophila]|uniref:Thymidylate kinase n=1 Tax=Lacunisphaera limnophila TaxID=1838286 RepID=A0A1D8AYW3_9BACT|nr:polyphosphate:AMP phosphotransferase [Lacunisphaera limnophila]AOS46054.1 Thymidylate kinase [Lacunisphaera limnophila]
MAQAKQRMAKRVYQARADVLRPQLVQLQLGLKQAPFKVLLIIAGPEGAGRGSLLNTLAEWLDPRGVETFSWHPPTDNERAHPHAWRFWRSLPGIGRIGLYAGSWYTETLRSEARNRRALSAVAAEAERIRDFEQVLVDGGTLIVKVWLHLSQEAQGRRLRTLRSDPATAWRVSDEDWHHHRIYGRMDRTARLIREKTDRPGARWTIIDAEDERARDLAVGRLLLTRFNQQLKRMAKLPRTKAPARVKPLRPAGLRRLNALPLDQDLTAKDYDTLREKWLGRLNRAVRAALTSGRSIVMAFEGWDAAGKGGAIRRLTSAIDPRDYSVIPVAKPTEEEKHAHYLWRFWRDLPRNGRMTVFDRSWYGRVLVERIEGFCREDEWRRAYAEINDFERQLTDHGVILLKYWLHVSHAEQLRRFREREATPHKRHKLNAEDWRNRRQRAAYEVAVGDMLALTDPVNAPWQLVPADNKRYARLEVLRSASRQIEAALEK